MRISKICLSSTVLICLKNLLGRFSGRGSIAVTVTMLDEFWDDDEGGFFYTGRSHETLIVRSKDFFDNATPAGNSVAAEVLLRFGLLTDNSDYQRRAATILRITAASLQRYPAGFGRLLCALDSTWAPREVAIMGSSDEAATHRCGRNLGPLPQ